MTDVRTLTVAAIQLQYGDILLDTGERILRAEHPVEKGRRGHRRVELLTDGVHRRVLLKPETLVRIERRR